MTQGDRSMATPTVPDATAVKDTATLKEIDQYLLIQHPAAREKIETMLGKELNIDMRAVVGGAVAGLPFGLPAKLALFFARLAMKRVIYAVNLYTLATGITTYSPNTDPDNYVGYLLYSWKEAGQPSYRFKFD
jgi:hypothetical protein